MKFLIILLFFICLICLTSITINIDKIEVSKNKIRFKIYLEVYILKTIRIVKKKIRKKTIYKVIDLIAIKKSSNQIKKNWYKIEEFKLLVNYGWKNIFQNIYFFATVNNIIPILINIINIQNREYTIKTSFDKNFFYFKVKCKIKIKIFHLVSDLIKSQLKKYHFFKKK